MNARHELKHSINHGEHTVLSGRLKAVLRRDDHADDAGLYRVRSLYFDTPGNRALKEKLASDDRREKFRIRTYPNQAGSPIHLEKKVKIHGLCSKSHVRITPDEFDLIVNGHFSWMASDERYLVVEFYSKLMGQMLRPKTIIEYNREPYTFPVGNVRITFDTDIRTSSRFEMFLSDNLPLLPAGDELVIMEVKYDAFLPGFIQSLIQIGNRKPIACSKYAIGRIYS
jgi:hypothetical protein